MHISVRARDCVYVCILAQFLAQLQVQLQDSNIRYNRDMPIILAQLQDSMLYMSATDLCPVLTQLRPVV